MRMGIKECHSGGKYHQWYGIWIRIESITQLLNYLKLWIKETWHDLNLSTHCIPSNDQYLHCISLKPEIIVHSVKGHDVKGGLLEEQTFEKEEMSVKLT